MTRELKEKLKEWVKVVDESTNGIFGRTIAAEELLEQLDKEPETNAKAQRGEGAEKKRS